MKLVTTLFVLALAGSCVAVSDFTNGVFQYFSLDSSSIINDLEQTYPIIFDGSDNGVKWEFDHLIFSPDIPADVVNHIQIKRENYNPWYTEIQTNIDNGRAKTEEVILNTFNSFSNVSEKVETSYNKMVEEFTKLGCTTYSEYEQNAQNTLVKILEQLSNQISTYGMHVQGSIPLSFIYPFSSALQNALTIPQQVPGVSMMTLVEQAENFAMNQVFDLYSSHVTYVTNFTEKYFSKLFSTTIDRINKVLDDMVNEVNVAACH